MRSITNLNRKCSPLSALAAAGAMVCLSEPASAVTGNIADSNGKSNIPSSSLLKAFSSKATWYLPLYTPTYKIAFTNWKNINLLNPDGDYAALHSSGVTISGAMPGGFENALLVKDSQFDKYFAVRFFDGGTRYGWIHLVSSAVDGRSVIVDVWGYNHEGGTIRTAAETIQPRRLDLSGGKVQLHWTSRNESGVSRYEVQSRVADGEWSAVESFSPGAGSYTLRAAGHQEYRLVTEKLDGNTAILDF